MYYSRTIARSNWASYLQQISKATEGEGVDISIVSEKELAHQSKLWSFFGITYDPYDDAVVISCSEQEHIISAPQLIRTEESAVGIHAIEITRSDNVREIIQFLEPIGIAHGPMAPAPLI
jgi:hypothetical protein